jgi:hypothetical protein
VDYDYLFAVEHFAMDLKQKEIIRLTQEFMARQGFR